MVTPDLSTRANGEKKEAAHRPSQAMKNLRTPASRSTTEKETVRRELLVDRGDVPGLRQRAARPADDLLLLVL